MARFNIQELNDNQRRLLAAALAKEVGNKARHTNAYVESPARNEPLAEGKAPVFVTRVDVHFHSIRKRLADPDGIVGKYCLDAIVRAGILADDSTKQVRQVTFSQEQGEPEETIITITSVDSNHDNETGR